MNLNIEGDSLVAELSGAEHEVGHSGFVLELSGGKVQLHRDVQVAKALGFQHGFKIHDWDQNGEDFQTWFMLRFMLVCFEKMRKG